MRKLVAVAVANDPLPPFCPEIIHLNVATHTDLRSPRKALLILTKPTRAKRRRTYPTGFAKPQTTGPKRGTRLVRRSVVIEQLNLSQALAGPSAVGLGKGCETAQIVGTVSHFDQSGSFSKFVGVRTITLEASMERPDPSSTES
jgi:hypothetical protein